ncbi:MAG: hypothetical protein U0931_05600 [Vulcanimicrobiota bacterium]
MMADDPKDRPIRKGPNPFTPIRIFKVSNPDVHNRMFQYRKYLLNKDWSNSKFQPSKTQAQPAAQAQAKSVGTGRPTFEVPLLVTFYQTSRRDYAEAERVIEKINHCFGPAGVSLRLDQDFTCPGESPQMDMGCPFAEDVDHEYEWLHLVFVARLPEDKPVLFNCGRCCLISDRCDDRSIARSLAMLLGLQPSQNVTHSGRLMGPESGYALTDSDTGWLRFYARAMVEEPVPFNKIVIPVWAYRVETPQAHKAQRSENEWRQILEGVSRIWMQAGIEFAFKGFAHLQEAELKAEIWPKLAEGSLPECGPWLDPLFRHASQAVHVLLANLPKGREVYTDPTRGVVLVNETLQSNRSRTVSWAFGCLLKLTGVTGVDQLMARKGEGFRISPGEMARARNYALARQQATAPKVVTPVIAPVALAPPKASSQPNELVIPLRPHLVLNPTNSCPLGLDEAKKLFADLNELWKPAGIRWQVMGLDLLKLNDQVLEATYPNATNVKTTRVQSCAGITALPIYEAHSLHLLLVNQLPMVPGSLFAQCTTWRPEHLCVIPTHFMKYTPLHGLARSLAYFLQLALVNNGPPELLTSNGAAGSKLAPAEITRARQNAEKLNAALRAPRPAITSPELSLKVRVRLLRGPKHSTSATPLSIQPLLQQLQQVWLAAGIRLLPEVSEEFGVSDIAVDAALPNESGDTRRQRNWTGFTGSPGFDPRSFNLFIIGKLTCISGKASFVTTYHRDSRCMLATTGISLGDLARGLAGFLGLTTNEYQSRQRLMSNTATSGTLLDSFEIHKARAECLKLFPR